MKIITGLIVFSFCLISYYIVLHVSLRKPKTHENTIYGMMITGKSPCRYQLALKSIENFFEQSYTNKHLMIINHGNQKLNINNNENITEIIIDKKSTSLGNLRNLCLYLIPDNHYWTLWDDDDYRSTNYLEYLYNNLKTNNADTVLFTKRLEYNYNNDYVWESQLKTGYVTLLSLKKPNQLVKYLDKDSMEDLNLIKDLRNNGHKIHIIKDNDPKIYIRLVHTDNTSLYVNKNKQNIHQNTSQNSIFTETNVDTKLANYTRNFMSNYYRNGLTCMKTLKN